MKKMVSKKKISKWTINYVEKIAYFCSKLLLFLQTMAENTAHTKELPQWLNVAIYLVLILLVVAFGDLFTVIIGIIGITVAFVAYFNSVSPEEHH